MDSRKEHENEIGRNLHLGLHSDLLLHKNWLTNQLSEAKDRIKELEGYVILYEQFIKNGVETNNIRIPDLIDPARKTIDNLLNKGE